MSLTTLTMRGESCYRIISMRTKRGMEPTPRPRIEWAGVMTTTPNTPSRSQRRSATGIGEIRALPAAQAAQLATILPWARRSLTQVKSRRTASLSPC